MLKPNRSSSLLLPFESLVNRCIGQDMKLAEGISRHSGKTLQLQCTMPALDIYVHFYPASVTLSFAAEDPRVETTAAGHRYANQTVDPNADAEPSAADARISGSAVTLLGLLTDRNRSLVNPALQISGDVEFVQSVYRLFTGMQIDWQEPLSRIIGDVPTHGLQQFLDRLKTATQQTADSVRRSLDEYLHEESRLVPPPNQVEAFDRELDALRLRLDRLQARVQLLRTDLDRQHQDQQEQS
ncbi:MAG: hypothetical protein R3F41_17240 [Gammaproteobacteria bacterium]|nr:hypothetical protein [Pseudomonadales bacterium]